MSYIYSLSDSFGICLCMAAMVCAALQVGAFVYMIIRGADKSVSRISGDVLQIMMILQSVTVLIMLAQARMDINLMLPLGRQYIALRYATFALVVLASVFSAFGFKSPLKILCIPFAAVILPILELLPDEVMTVWLCASIAFMSLRSVVLIIKCRRDIKSRLSRDSVKMAVDELHSGVLFCRKNGKILLINTRMQKLMLDLYGEIFRDGKEFWKKVSTGDHRAEYGAKQIGDSPMYILPDGKAWLFSKCYIYASGNRFVQVSAADITEQWKLTGRLAEQHTQLKNREAELKDMIENIRQLGREEEILKAKNRFHDVLGQRLALLFRGLRESLEPDEKLLKDFVSGLPDELRGKEPVITAEDRLQTLVSIMKKIGVTVCVRGNLPENESMALLWTDIITEATTNSVRHGMASEVYINLEKADGRYNIHVTDNGLPTDGEFTVGGGLSSIKNKAELFDGYMTAEAKPRFTLFVSVPGGENS